MGGRRCRYTPVLGDGSTRLCPWKISNGTCQNDQEVMYGPCVPSRLLYNELCCTNGMDEQSDEGSCRRSRWRPPGRSIAVTPSIMTTAVFIGSLLVVIPGRKVLRYLRKMAMMAHGFPPVIPIYIFKMTMARNSRRILTSHSGSILYLRNQAHIYLYDQSMLNRSSYSRRSQRIIGIRLHQHLPILNRMSKFDRSSRLKH